MARSPDLRSRSWILLLVFLAATLYLVWRVRQDHEPPTRATSSSKTTSRRSEPLQIPAAAREARAIRAVIRGGWGSGAGEFGQLTANESNPEGPMSAATLPNGELLVLDQVNLRLQRFSRDGRLLGSQRIGSATAQDLVVDGAGRTHVLSRHGADTGIESYGPDGRLEKKLTVVGGRVSEGGAITGLFADRSGLYVETENDELVRVASTTGEQGKLDQTIPGRPTRDGRLHIKAGVIDKASGRAYVQAHLADGKTPPTLAWERPLTFAAPLLHVLLLDSDRDGRIYLGVETAQEDPATHKLEDVATVVVRLEGSAGKLTGTLTLPPTTADPTERFRPLVVADDGTLYQLLASPAGFTITAHRFDP
jgi:hypothetical protein